MGGMKTTFEYDITLADLRESETLEGIAQMIGVQKDAVRQMLVNERDIYLKQIGSRWHYCELKPWKRGNSVVSANKGRMTKKRARRAAKKGRAA